MLDADTSRAVLRTKEHELLSAGLMKVTSTF